MQDPRKIDPALLKKYDVSGPRYTSYPPATHFHPVEIADLESRWSTAGGLKNDPGLSIYVHIPFCRSRCLFCGCYTCITHDRGVVSGYMDTLVREMKLLASRVDPGIPVRQIALGGGTPNFPETAELERLLSSMEEIWSIEKGAERSVEIDPRTATPEKLGVFLMHGFDRFSLGVQDFDPEVLSLVRHGQDLMQVEEVVGFLRGSGVGAINFDLIYGLPGQTAETALATAMEVVRLRPSRIALYSYAHVPWIKAHQKALERHGLPSPELKMAMFLAMLDAFKAAGYAEIGMDHFALPDDSLALALASGTLHRNFMGYTTRRGLDLAAFGASAISFISTAYSQNKKDLDAYMASVDRGELPVERGFLLSREDEIRREFILDLFCNFAVDLARFGERHGLDAEAFFSDDFKGLAPLAADGLVSLTGGRVAATETGRFFIRNICMAFDRYLEKDAAGRMYSRTV